VGLRQSPDLNQRCGVGNGSGPLLAAEMEQLAAVCAGEVWGWRTPGERGTGRSEFPLGLLPLKLLLGSGHGPPRNTVVPHCKDHELGDLQPSSACPGDRCASADPAGRNRNGPLERLSWPSGAKAASAPRQHRDWPLRGNRAALVPTPPGNRCALRKRILEAVPPIACPPTCRIWRLPLSQQCFSPEHRGLPWYPQPSC